MYYLSANGIAKKRLEATGLGETTPKRVTKGIAAQFDFLQEGDVLSDDFIELLTPEQQARADQINRRTEFRVTEPTFFSH